MPDNYEVLDTQPTVQVYGPNAIFDEQIITIITKPTGIRAMALVSDADWKAGQASDLLGSFATDLEGLVADHHVVGGSPTQDLDGSGLLALFVDLIVRYDRSSLFLPPLDGVARVPMSAFVLTNLGIGGFVPSGTTTPSQYVDAEYQRLVSIGGA
jgi:hypothetical protein